MRKRSKEVASEGNVLGQHAVEKKAKGNAKDNEAEETSQETKSKEIFYLMKSEPHEFSLDDLIGKKNSTHYWEGVRNAQARNVMRSMQVGQQAFFYHSSCKTPGIVGIIEVVREAHPDPFQWDPKSKYYDPKSSKEAPKWDMVDVKLVRKLRRMISLQELKSYKDTELRGMSLFVQSRLSVQPVSKAHWDFILSLEDAEE